MACAHDDYQLTEIQLAMGLARLRDLIKEHWDILRYDWHRSYAHKQLVRNYIVPNIEIPEMVLEELRLVDQRWVELGYPPEYRRYYQRETDEAICGRLERIRLFWITKQEAQKDECYRQYLHVQLQRRFVDRKIPIPAKTIEDLKLSDARLRELNCATEFEKYYHEE
jgi:hypothetical protein